MGELIQTDAWRISFADAVEEVERRGYAVRLVANHDVEAHIWFRPAVEIDGLRRNFISGRDNVEIMRAARALPAREA